MVAAKVCIPAAARPRQQCMGKRILVGRVGDRHDILAGTPLVLFVDTTIVASGAAIGTQVSAAIAFVVALSSGP
jgi:hypothetical protein